MMRKLLTVTACGLLVAMTALAENAAEIGSVRLKGYLGERLDAMIERHVCGADVDYMCGVLMASVGFVESVLGLTPEQVAVVMAFYMALDGYGPAANVTGDGAIALICERFFGRVGEKGGLRPSDCD